MAAERRGQVFIVSGPSGTGKTTVVEHLLEALPDIRFSVSYTTRGPRASEQEGREYHFVDRQTFQAMIARDDFLEYADVFGFLYGTPRQAVSEAERQGKDVLLDIDVQGARQVKAKLPDAVAILLLPPSGPALEKRLRDRGLDAPEIMRRRLDRARMEIENYDTYDYVVINENLEDTCAHAKAIVLAEQHRRAGGGAPSAVVQAAEAQAAAARKEAKRQQVSAILESFGARTQ